MYSLHSHFTSFLARSSSIRPATDGYATATVGMAKGLDSFSAVRIGWDRLGHRGCGLRSRRLPVLAIEVSPARSTLALVERTVTQDQGAWVVDYRLRHTGPTGVIVTPEEIGVKVEGWVSNSRVASHAVPRWSSLVVSRGRSYRPSPR